MTRPRVTAVMLAYGPEPYLVDAAGVLASTDVDIELIVVDNGAPATASTSSRASPGYG